jgi:hypothetical protein
MIARALYFLSTLSSVLQLILQFFDATELIASIDVPITNSILTVAALALTHHS